MGLGAVREEQDSFLFASLGAYNALVEVNRGPGNVGEERSVQMAAMEPCRLVAAIRDISVSVDGDNLI